MISARSTINIAGAAEAYKRLGKRLGKNLIKRALRAALIPVRQKVKAGWKSANYRSGPRKWIKPPAPKVSIVQRIARGVSTILGAKPEPEKKKRRKRAPKRKIRRNHKTSPNIVRRAIVSATTLKADRLSTGAFVGGVGIDYSKRGLRTQQRQFTFLEAGRRKGTRTPAAQISKRINRAEVRPATRRFLDALHKGMAS